jgi:hypothetical protein
MSANLRSPEFDQVRQQPGFRARHAFLGRQAGAQKLGISLWDYFDGETPPSR